MKNVLQKVSSLLWAIVLIGFPLSVHAQSGKNYTAKSPNGKIELTVIAGKDIKWQVNHENTQVITPSVVSMTLSTGEILGKNVKSPKVETSSVNTSFATPFYKRSSVADQYNQLSLRFKDYGLEFRIYDDGVAYRFVTGKKGEIIIKDEEANFNFAGDYKAFVPYINDMRQGERYTYSFESFYDEIRLSEMRPDSMSITPLLVDLGNGKKVAILDMDLEDYAGMFLVVNRQTMRGLQSEFARYPLEGRMAGINFIATKRADYIAKTKGTRTFPWRAVVISEKDVDLANSDMAQKLASPSRISDVSWIKPGKVSWDWWNNNNLYRVDFKAGKNMETYKYFIDFASANKLEYIIIDAGWSGRNSLMESIPTMNIQELVDYGNSKNVGIILWASWAAADKEMNEVFPYYSKMGVKGFKVDFFDSDDQKMVQSMYAMSRVAAENRLLLDLHGMKPYGLQRTYPNVVNFEGVKGLENFRWAPIVNGKIRDDVPRYDVIIPYVRAMCGPMDYTPGAMNNATRTGYRTVERHPMSQGTRVHQMAMYTVFDAPLQMLADSPTEYMKEQECTDFIAKVPTVFDESVFLEGEVGEYIIMARKKGEVWYVGAMTNWTGREKTIDFSFLGNGDFEAEVFKDGINADIEAKDYKKEIIRLSASDRKTIQMMQGGGWTARIYPVR